MDIVKPQQDTEKPSTVLFRALEKAKDEQSVGERAAASERWRASGGERVVASERWRASGVEARPPSQGRAPCLPPPPPPPPNSPPHPPTYPPSRPRRYDVLIIDTSGRLSNNYALNEELKKVI